jgi:NADPH-dependent 2,4-dienoyl-CoA reductase/sulfur reductase-like enzyme
MKHYDVIIIGAGPSGIITGTTGIKENPDKTFLMLMEEEKGLVPCGIPYVFHDLDDISKNLMGPAPFAQAGGVVAVDTVTEVDVDGKSLKTKSGETYTWDKLVFATGSTPTVPTFIKGHQLGNVEYVRKSHKSISELLVKCTAARNIVVIGGGFIGAEMAEQLARHQDKTITLVEMEEHCLNRAFSSDFAAMADAHLANSGVNVLCGCTVSEIRGTTSVESVVLNDGRTIPADLVIAAVGYTPRTELAANAGLTINRNRTIAVDRYMRTDKPDVFAVGDCSSTSGFITGNTDNIMLASTATAEARVLGYNLYSIGLLRNFAGTLSVFSTEFDGYAFASAGALEESARRANIDFVVGRFEDVDRHPGALPGAKKMIVKIVVTPQTGRIIGAEIYGGKSVGELINLVGLAIQKQVTIYELVSFQMGTHPLLTPAPTKYILVKACENAITAIRKRCCQ